VLAIVPPLGRALITLIGRSLSVEELRADAVLSRIHRPASRPCLDRRPVVFAFWHNRIFYGSYYLCWRFVWRKAPCSALISESRDGELIARTAQALGGNVVRGSSSRGARQGFLGLLRRARHGDCLLITPDGPRGPRYVAQGGVALLAAKARLPVVPLGFGFSQALEFGSWDGFTIPVPGARVVVSYGEPIDVAHDADEAALEAARARIEQSLRAATDEAERRARQRLFRVTRRTRKQALPG